MSVLKSENQNVDDTAANHTEELPTLPTSSYALEGMSLPMMQRANVKPENRCEEIELKISHLKIGESFTVKTHELTGLIELYDGDTFAPAFERMNAATITFERIFNDPGQPAAYCLKLKGPQKVATLLPGKYEAWDEIGTDTPSMISGSRAAKAFELVEEGMLITFQRAIGGRTAFIVLQPPKN